jgi:hypothetical protein
MMLLLSWYAYSSLINIVTAMVLHVRTSVVIRFTPPGRFEIIVDSHDSWFAVPVIDVGPDTGQAVPVEH